MPETDAKSVGTRRVERPRSRLAVGGSKAALGVIQVHNCDDRGSASVRSAWELHQAYRRRGIDAWMAVARKFSVDPRVILLNGDGARPLWADRLLRVGTMLQLTGQRFPGAWRLAQAVKLMAEPERLWRTLRNGTGGFPAETRQLVEWVLGRGHVLHLHEVEGVLDLHRLPLLSRQVPVIWSIDEERLRRLEQLTESSPNPSCASLLRSRLNVALPSEWARVRIQESPLAAALAEVRVIRPGVDLSVFSPGDRAAARRALRLPGQTRVVLADGLVSTGGEEAAAYVALRRLGRKLGEGETVLVIAFGPPAPSERVCGVEIRYVFPDKNPQRRARFHQAADACLYAGEGSSGTYGLAEALSCGLPVVAPPVHGLDEVLPGGDDGFLVPEGSPDEMAARLHALLFDSGLRARYASKARAVAEDVFDLEREVDQYIEWYRELSER